MRFVYAYNGATTRIPGVFKRWSRFLPIYGQPSSLHARVRNEER